MGISYKEQWAMWGITTALQSLILMEKDTYTVADFLNIAKYYKVEDMLIERFTESLDLLDE